MVLISHRESTWTEFSLQTFALNCCVPETLSKVVLGAVSSTVSTVADDWDDQFLIFSVVGKDLFESIWQVVEILVVWNFTLNDSWLDANRSTGSTVVDSIKTHTSVALFEVVSSLSHFSRQYLKAFLISSNHASLDTPFGARLIYVTLKGSSI